MKITKIIAAIAASAVITASSMVGMSASATTDNHMNNTCEASLSADGYFNPSYNGAYYEDNGTSFILISGTSYDNAKITFSQVYYGGQVISGVCEPSVNGGAFVTGSTGHAFSVTFPTGQWYYISNDVRYTGSYEHTVDGKIYTDGTISIGGKTYTR